MTDVDSPKVMPPAKAFDPQAPVTRKGVLTSFRTGCPMPILESDVVSTILLVYFISFLIFTLQLGRCRLVTEFEKLNRIGEGTYGIVCKYL